MHLVMMVGRSVGHGASGRESESEEGYFHVHSKEKERERAENVEV